MARPEVTGRKQGASAGQAKQDERVDPPEPPKLLAMTIPQFCAAHGIAVGTYFKQKKEGNGPREMRIGSRVLISHEASADWRRAREDDIEAAERASKVWADSRTMMCGPRPKAGKVKPKPSAKAEA